MRVEGYLFPEVPTLRNINVPVRWLFVLLMFGRSWTSCTGDSVPKLRIHLFNSHSKWCFLVTIDEMLDPRECFLFPSMI